MSVGRRRFRIIKEIAEGGFGKVYLAEQISSDGFSRIVAVKLLHAKWSSHDEVVMRTRDEARLLGLIRHQHIVKVEDLTAIDGKCAIVMEYLEGVDLKWMTQFLKDRDMHFPRCALFEIMLAVASALDAAYNGRPLQGGDPLRVIHRDIKPSNIFVTVAGGVKVLDFGTARANFAEREAKTQALAFGSQGYMAPERMLGEEDTPAADMFSLGITLYELLSLESFGRIPPRPNKFLKKVEDRVKSVPLKGDTDWAEQVRDTLRLMLSYEPSDRPSAGQLVEIMELLSQDGQDMQLRRFCRTLVGEAKTALPDLETGDPLAGTVVDEDASASFQTSNTGPQPAVPAPPPPSGLPIPGMQTVQPRSDPGAPASIAELPSMPGSLADYEISSPRAEESGGGGGGKAIGFVVVGFMVFAVVVLIGAVTAGVVAAVALGGDNGAPDPEPIAVPEPVPDTPDVPVPDPGAPDPGEPEAGGGGRIISPDRRADVAKSPTKIKYGDPEGAKVVIKNGDGFSAEWDGKAEFDLGELGSGRYSTLIETAAGKKIRGKSFTVEGGKGSCAFTFDPGGSDWTGGVWLIAST